VFCEGKPLSWITSRADWLRYRGLLPMLF